MMSKYLSNGYAIIQEQNEIREFMESKGSKGNPDLIAHKDKEILLVEVIERVKTRPTFVNQLVRYTRIGKVIVVLPVNTTNIEIWGTRSLI